MNTLQNKNKKLSKFCGFVEHSRAKKLSASGGFAPDPPPEALPLDPAGAPPQTPVIRARHGLRAPPNENLGSAPCLSLLATKIVLDLIKY